MTATPERCPRCKRIVWDGGHGIDSDRDCTADAHGAWECRTLARALDAEARIDANDRAAAMSLARHSAWLEGEFEKAKARADAAEAREAWLRAVVDARLIAIGITADEMERADCRVCGSFAPRFRKWIAAFDADLRAALKETP